MPNSQPTGGQPPSSRRGRREASARPQPAPLAPRAEPAWQSPMLSSPSGVAVGLVVILSRPGAQQGNGGGAR
jgi:hypothetical protein